MQSSEYSFEDLEVYKAAREYRKKIYRLVRQLPSNEKYVLDPQMRRAAISLTNNIAEGHGRYHYQETIQFLRHSRGSLEELMDDLNVCLDEQYAAVNDVEKLKIESYDVLKRINGYTAYLRKRKHDDL